MIKCAPTAVVVPNLNLSVVENKPSNAAPKYKLYNLIIPIEIYLSIVCKDFSHILTKQRCLVLYYTPTLEYLAHVHFGAKHVLAKLKLNIFSICEHCAVDSLNRRR